MERNLRRRASDGHALQSVTFCRLDLPQQFRMPITTDRRASLASDEVARELGLSLLRELQAVRPIEERSDYSPQVLRPCAWHVSLSRLRPSSCTPVPVLPTRSHFVDRHAIP